VTPHVERSARRVDDVAAGRARADAFTGSRRAASGLGPSIPLAGSPPGACRLAVPRGLPGQVPFDYDYPAEAAPFYFEDRDRDPAAYVPLPFKPETRENDPRPEVIANMVQAINTSSAAVFRTAVTEFIDLAQFVRHVATEVFLADQDGFLGNWGMNNFFMYRPALANQFRLIVWDKSQAFVDGPGYPIWHNITDVPEANRNRLMSRALEYADLRDVYLDTLLEAGRSASEVAVEVAPGDVRGWLEREIDRADILIAPSVLADSLKPYTNDEFIAAVNALRVFARERTAFVNAEVAVSR
jgi:hypothetical protein